MDIEEIFAEYLKTSGITKLYEHQKEAIGLLKDGKSVLLSTPTTSGKSLVAYYGILNNWARKMRSMYIVPLKALAEEKGRELKHFEKYGLKVKVSTGDYEETGGFIRHNDVIVTTSEKADSLLRNSPDAFNDFGFIVIDEIHTLGSEGRGDTLEILITKFLHIFHDLQLMAMSATVGNYEEIGKWINATVVKSDFRPVPLRRYIIAGNEIYNEDGEHEGSITSLEEFIDETVRDGGQTIIFESTRKSTELDAKKYTKKYIYPIDNFQSDLSNIGDLPGANELLDMIKNGVAYHHAGIVTEVRNLIEKLFLERKIKVLFATTTLAAGINLPARTVIIKSIFRYDGLMNDTIPNMEIQQMLGRAGRSRFDKMGYGYIVVSKYNLRMAYDRYIMGPVENVNSMITRDNLKKHILGVIASGIAKDRKEIKDFFSKTFFATNNQDIESLVSPGVDYLIEYDFVKENRGFRTTPFGKRTSELYIEPESAVILRNSLDMEDIMELLLRISSTPDIMKINVSTSEEEDYYHPDFDESIVKLSRILFDWIQEEPEEKIIEKYRIYPADLRNRVESAEWLVYSLHELGKILHKSKNLHRELYYRIKYGIRSDLIPLVELPYVGRVRARRLSLAGFDRKRIAMSTPEELMRISGIGETIANKIIEYARKIENID